MPRSVTIPHIVYLLMCSRNTGQFRRSEKMICRKFLRAVAGSLPRNEIPTFITALYSVLLHQRFFGWLDIPYAIIKCLTDMQTGLPFYDLSHLPLDGPGPFLLGLTCCFCCGIQQHFEVPENMSRMLRDALVQGELLGIVEKFRSAKAPGGFCGWLREGWDKRAAIVTF
jgi:hypothetical protein